MNLGRPYGLALPDCNFIDLSHAPYNRRTAIALTKYCDAGVTLDTFLLHGSQAVGASHVVAIMISSHPEVVCYPDQCIKNGLIQNITPCMIVDELSHFLVPSNVRNIHSPQGPHLRL